MKTYDVTSWWVKKKKKKKHTLLVFITLTLLILHFQTKECVGCVDTERMGLLQLKSYLKCAKKENILKSWSHDDPMSDCCHWERVKCSDAVGGHIVSLSLDQLVPEAYWDTHPRPLNLSLLHSLPQLTTLDLSMNGFNCLFDPLHGLRTTKLKTLDLSFNKFSDTTAQLKVLKDMRTLQELDLSDNKFVDLNNLGSMLPSSLEMLNLRRNQLSYIHKGYSDFCGLTNLRELDLSSNALTNMPNCLGNLTHLRTFDISRNELKGNLSSFVSGLPSTLEYLSLLDNYFNGSFFFNSLVNHTRLTVFKLSSKVGMIQDFTESSWVPLFQLKMLKLYNFTFGSTIPKFLLHQHNLSYVDISYNELKGAFPAWLVENNTRLHALLLKSNSLTKLQLPRLVHGLQVLDISSNIIFNSIPKDIGIVFPKLTYLNFSSNRFQGTIPPSMDEMKSLKFLDMSSNGLYGQLPKKFLSSCYSLGFLKLSNNQFQGKIFSEHANLTGLSVLFLRENNFSGSLGKGLLNSKKLTLLDISYNSFSGTLPLWIGRMSSLWFLYMRGNQLKGHFPSQLKNLQQLKVIDISHNSFSGSIPKNFDFSSLTELRLQNNEFMGSIPSTLFNAPLLKVLDLRNNNFSGKILNNIGKISKLRVLLLSNNSLQSHIPREICQLSKVGLMDLSHNKFKGVIPSCLGNMSFGVDYGGVCIFYDTFDKLRIPFLQNWSYTSAFNFDDYLDNRYLSTSATIVDFITKRRYEAYQGDILRYMHGLDLSSNQLSGEIPADIGDLQLIKSLNLSSNQLTGSIPESISKLKDLESLDLSNNKLYGNIPPRLVDLNNLGFFNVSYNNLSGEIPFKDHFVTFDSKSYIGNVDLCGLCINKSCHHTGFPESGTSKHVEEKEEKASDDMIDMVWFYWTCGAVYISTFLIFSALLSIDSRWSREWFYRVDLLVHHLQRFKSHFVCN